MVTETKDKAPSDFVRVTPPKRETRSSSGTKSRGRSKNLTPKLEDFFTSIGTVVYAVNATDGAAILQGTPNLAKSLNELAKEDERVRRVLERMLTGSAYGAVFMSTAAILLPILDNHGMLPVRLPKQMMPDVPKESKDSNGG